MGAERLARDYDTAAAFEYGEAVLREVLRLKPAAPLLALEPLTDAVVAGVRVRAGTRLLLLTRFAATRETSFTDAARFDPDRWLGGSPAICTHDADAFLPFGAGPRFCPGRNLALLEGKAALAMIARNFEIELDPSTEPVQERFHFTMGPHGLRIRLRQREAGWLLSRSAPPFATRPRGRRMRTGSPPWRPVS